MSTVGILAIGAALAGGIVVGLLVFARMRRRVQRAESELREASSLLAIARVIGGTTDLVEGFRLVCRELATLTGAETVSAYVLDRSATELRPIAGYRIPREALPVLGSTPLPLGEQGFATTVFEDGRPVWTDDVQHDPRFAYPLFRRFPHRTGLIIPLVLDGAPAGAFYLVWWKDVRRFAPAELAVTETIGRQVGILLRNIRLHDALDVRAARLGTLVRVSRLVSSSLDVHEVLGEIARAAAELMEARVVHVWVIDESGATFDLAATSDPAISQDFGAPHVSIEGGGIGRAVARREMLHFPDVFAEDSPVLDHAWWRRHGLTSLLDIPIVSDGTVLGVLALHGARPFVLGDDDRALLDSFVAQAGFALDHARSYEVQGRLLVQTRRQQQEAMALEATARDIASALDRRELFTRITDRVRELIAADVAFLAIFDRATETARVVAVSGARTPLLGRLVVPAAEGRMGAVLHAAEIVYVHEAAEGILAAPAEEDAARGEGIVAQVLVPLTFQGRVIGVLSGAHRSARPFSPSQLDVLTRLAAQAAIAIENRQLYEEQRRRSTRLELLNRVTREIARATDASGILAAIAEGVPALFADAACRLWVVEDTRIELVAEAGLPESTPGGRTVLAMGEGIVGRVCASGEPVVLANVSAAPDALNVAWMRQQGVASAAVLPLVAERCVGALAIVTRVHHVFGDDDLSLLRAFGEHAAVAIEKARAARTATSSRA